MIVDKFRAVFHLNRYAALLLGAAVLFALPLVYLYLDITPLQIHTTNGKATIVFTADRNRVLFPGQCINVTWDVQGIQAVYLNGKGRVGTGEQELCTVNARPLLRVEFQDGSSSDYTLPVEALYRRPETAFLLGAALAALGAAVYLLWGINGLVLVATMAIFGPMLRIQLNQGQDYIDHTMFAGLGTQNFNNLPPHFLYHIAVLGLHDVLPAVNLEQAGFFVMLAAYLATALILLVMLRWMAGVEAHERCSLFLCGAAALALMLVGPISFLSDRFNPAEYNALIYPNVYHNPTIGLLRPLALFLYFGILGLLAAPKQWGWRYVSGLAALTIMGTLAKPSYTLALAPALVILTGYNVIRSFRLNWKMVIIGILIPAALVMGWQYLFLYSPQGQSRVYSQPTHIAFAPFELYLNAWKVPWGWLPVELVLSTLFPLAVYGVYFRSSRQSVGLNLAWLVFIIGVAVAYLFVEVPGTSNGNLTWSAEIGLFILFAVSTGFFLKQSASILRGEARIDWRFSLCVLVFAVHLVNRLSVLVR